MNNNNFNNNKNILDFNNKRIERLRNIYIKGENDYFSFDDIKNIMNAREELLQTLGLNIYNQKIIFITKELYNKKNKNKEYATIYIIFTKCLDFLLSYNCPNELKEKYIRYINILYIYLRNNINLKKNLNINALIRSIKILTFDIQTMLVEVYQDN